MSQTSLVGKDVAISNHEGANDKSPAFLNGHTPSNALNDGSHPMASGCNTNVEMSNGCHQSGEMRAPPPIAIVGMGMRLPGGVDDEQSFWEMLVNKGNGQCVVPEDRYNIESFYSPSGKSGTVKTKYGYFLDGSELQSLDTSFFSMTKAEVDKLDPQQRLLLEVVWECMQNAGQVNWRGKNIGFYVGVFGEDWLDITSKDTQHLGMYRISGSGDFALANRVSYEYNLSGPSMTIQTGCSSSLIGLHQACQAIINGDCSSAIVAGTNLIMSPTTTVAMSEQGVLSPTGLCKSFDAKADGYGRGEAVNAVYIKKLSDALQDGDPVRAVIRATATNCDGKTPGMAYPSSETHEALMRKVYQVAHIDNLAQTAFVECHGTGTAVGDPLETVAIANVFGHEGVWIGSVKPNVGHSEGASGITSLIKVVLSLEHQQIPPNINFSEPNPKIPFKSAQLQVPLETTPWPTNRAERASVNSFGIGGSNAHVIVDSAATFGAQNINVDSRRTTTRPHLLVFSASHPDSLRRQVTAYHAWVPSNLPLLADASHTLGARRDHLTHRAFCVTDGNGTLDMSSFAKAKLSPQIVFVFTGQGAQWAEMAKDLMHDYPEFCKDIKAMDKTLSGLPSAPTWTIEDELLKPEASSRLDKAEFSQPLCTAVQIGLVNLLRSWGVRATAVLGHSSGEIAAAYAADIIDADTAILIAFYRGQVTKRQRTLGGMMAVGMGRQLVSSYLVDGVVVACENSPTSVTLSGDMKQINVVADKIKADQPETFVRQLKVEMAYHSHHMREFGAEYEELLRGLVRTRPGSAQYFSTVTGDVISDSTLLGASYWRQNLESPVLFDSAIRHALEEIPTDTLFIEIGPHAALSGPLRQNFKANSTDITRTYVPTLLRGKNCTSSILNAAGNLYLQGVPIIFAKVTPGQTVLTDLPNYQWRHEMKHWNESRIAREWRFRKFPRHELLGSRTLEGNDLEPTWRNVLRLDDAPWIRDHKIINDVVFPAAGYIAMAGEAIRQITGVDDFSLRQVLIKTALVLQDSKAVELTLSLRPLRLTTSLDSAWYEFSILSFNDTVWTKHCAGQVRAGFHHAPMPVEIHDLPREVASSSWYTAMNKIGLAYGPAFQGLTGITSDTVSPHAVASLSDQSASSESTYQLHPTTIDLCLQMIIVAAAKGASRLLPNLCVPTNIEEIYVRSAECNLRASVVAATSSNGALTGDAIVMAGSEVALQIKQGRSSPLEGPSQISSSDAMAGAQLQWRPDIDFIPADKLMRPRVDLRTEICKLEKLALLCILETRDRISSSLTDIEHLRRFKEWINLQTRRAVSGEYQLVPNARELADLSGNDRQEAIKNAVKAVENNEVYKIAKVLLRVLEQITSIFEGKIDPIAVLHEDHGLNDIYQFYSVMWDCHDFFALLGHARPVLRVLEIGAGTGGTTAAVLKDLISPSGIRMYSEYAYTDISAGFFVAAKDKFKEYRNIQYAILDITKDPIAQGFEAGSCDLIIASNVIHATPSIATSLRNIRTLLHPQGRLFLQELTPVVRKLNYIMGILPGWWLGAGRGRDLEPYISPDQWDVELRSAGFSGVDSIVYDNEEPYHINVNMISAPAKIENHPMEVTILGSSKTDPTAQQMQAVFASKGLSVEISTLDQTPPAGQTIISLLDLSDPFFDESSAKDLKKFQTYLEGLQSSGILWVTKSAQIACKDPRYGQILGIARTVRSELLIDFATLEVDTWNEFTPDIVYRVSLKFRNRVKGPVFDPDWEFALVDGAVQIPRYQWMSGSQPSTELAGTSDAPRKLAVGRFGSLDTLHWIQDSPNITLGDDEVEVEPRAVGMNFKDILVCMGVVEGTKTGLGLEGSGIVRRVGPAVRNLSIGDRVIIFDQGCFSTRHVLSSKVCAKIPSGLSFEEAATLPCVYSTVIHALLTLGNLKEENTVLIHSACGGVGLAAIQICQMKGAQIYVSVGNDEKVQFLMNTFGIPRNHIFNSRDTSFLPRLKEETSGKGVDLVLNSLSGELLHASWKCVAESGKMLEIGKRDFIGRGSLDMDIFEANRSFFGIDLAKLGVAKPEIFQNLLDQCIGFYREGCIGPIKPMKMFEATQVLNAFKYMQKGQHIGKIVVTMPKDPADLGVTAAQAELRLRSDVSYLLVGGLGGLGHAVSTWLVEQGARNIVYLSRSAGESEDDQKFFRELKSQGCTIQTFAGSVSDLSDVKRAVKGAMAPVAGVMHMSMVLRDKALLQFTHDEWQTAISPIVKGAWNLHEALAEQPLDFFILFSSTSGLVGQWGQANYSAANTFLDSFVQYRQSLGQVASVLDIGVIDDVGYVSQNTAVLEQFKANSVYTLREQNLLDALRLMMAKQTAQPPTANTGYMNPAQLVIGLRSTKLLSDPNNRSIWKRDIRMSLYRNFETEGSEVNQTANEGLKHFLIGVASDPSMLAKPANLDFLTREIGLRIYAFMLQSEEELDVQQSLQSLGVDSLVAIEIRSWWRQSLGLEISVLEIMNAGSIAQLGRVASEALQQKYAVAGKEEEDTYLLMKAP